MSTLSHSPAPVHAARVFRSRAEEAPADLWPRTPEPEYTPTPEDLAYDTGWVVGLEDGLFRMPSAWKNDGRGLRFAMGRQAGRRHREADEARELGRALGLETGPSEPPAGLTRHEADAFRHGFAGGLAERERLDEEARDEDAYHDQLARDRMEWVSGDPSDLVHHAEIAEICGADVARRGFFS